MMLSDPVLTIKSGQVDGSSGPPAWITQRIASRTQGPSTFEILMPVEINGADFIIDPTTGQIQVLGAQLNFETQNSYTFNIFVEDNGSPPLGAMTEITVLVEDVNESPSIFDVVFSIEENSVMHTPVSARLSATDPDLDQLLSFSLVNHATNIFRVEACNGEITVNKEQLDYESTKVYYLTTKVTDSGVTGTDLLSDTATATIQIIDINEAPEISGGMSTTVEENLRVGTQVGLPVSVRTKDQDSGDKKYLRYSIVDGNTLGHFTIDRLDGQISVVSNINYEALPEYTVLPKPEPICATSQEPPSPKEINHLLRVTTGDDHRLPSGEDMECIGGTEQSASPNTFTKVSTCNVGYTPFGLRQIKTVGLKDGEQIREQICDHTGCKVACPVSGNAEAKCYVTSQCCRSKISQNQPPTTFAVFE